MDWLSGIWDLISGLFGGGGGGATTGTVGGDLSTYGAGGAGQGMAGGYSWLPSFDSSMGALGTLGQAGNLGMQAYGAFGAPQGESTGIPTAPSMPRLSQDQLRSLTSRRQSQGVYTGGAVTPESTAALLGPEYTPEMVQQLMQQMGGRLA